MMQLIEIEYGTEDYLQELQLRDDMLRKPIGLEHSEADLVAEKGYRHFGIKRDQKLVACLMVVPRADRCSQIRQMAVDAHLQGNGYGRFLMTAVEALLRDEREITRIYLNARKTALGFYEKLGYQIVGSEFIEVGIPHFRMEKDLRPAG